MADHDLPEAIEIAQDDLDAATRRATEQGFLTIDQRLLFSLAQAVIALARELHELREDLRRRATDDVAQSMWIGSMPEPAMNVCPLCGKTRSDHGPIAQACQHSFHQGEPAVG